MSQHDGFPIRRRLLTAAEVAPLLAVSEETVYRMCRKGILKSVKWDRLVRIPDDAVDELIEAGVRRRGPKGGGGRDGEA